MELKGSMPHSQGLSNNSYPEPNQPIQECSTGDKFKEMFISKKRESYFKITLKKLNMWLTAPKGAT